MTDDDTKLTKADDAADLVLDALIEMQRVSEFPTEAILAGAHATVVALMAVHLGGTAAAEVCERAASSVRHLPSRATCSLARVKPAGRA